MKTMKRRLCAIMCAALLAGALVPTASAATFTDTSGHWAEDYIETCAGRGIVDGVGGGKFEPEGKVTNAQFVKMLCSAFFAAEEQTFENENRAAIDDYFGGSVQWYAYKSYYFQKLDLLNNVDYNIQSATSANQPMNRNNMVQVAANVLKQKGIAANEQDKAVAQANLVMAGDYFTIPESNRGAVMTCYALGVITGTDGGKFDGGNTMTRAQACTVITRLLDAVDVAKADKPAPLPTPSTPIDPTPEYKDIEVTTSTMSMGTAYHITDNDNPTGYLANGKPINEANIAELLQKAKTIWPTGMTWAGRVEVLTGNNWYANPGTVARNMLHTNGVFTDATTACGGFSAMISDYLFGKTANPCHLVTNFSDIRPGDVVVQLEADKSTKHVMIVTSLVKTGRFAGDGVFIADGNRDDKVFWSDETDEWNSWDNDMLADNGSYIVLSRWPD